MTVDFSSETIEGQKKVAQYFASVEREALSNMNSVLQKSSLRNKVEISTL